MCRVMIAIERCRLSERCTQRWQSLEAVRGNPHLRYCSQCQAAVHLVEHEHEALELARQGKSVAVLRKDPPVVADRPNAR
jgi:hypothetical protein